MKNNDTNRQMRFSFLTNARTMGVLGLISGLFGTIAGVFLPGVGLALGTEATALAFIGYRQQKKQAETGRVVYAALVLGLVALAVSIISAFFIGGRPV